MYCGLQQVLSSPRYSPNQSHFILNSLSSFSFVFFFLSFPYRHAKKHINPIPLSVLLLLLLPICPFLGPNITLLTFSFFIFLFLLWAPPLLISSLYMFLFLLKILGSNPILCSRPMLFSVLDRVRYTVMVYMDFLFL